jgi:hypothetical protein
MTYAEREFDILSKIEKKTGDEFLVTPFKKEILAIFNKFMDSGQSGGSAPYYAQAVAGAIKDLCLQKPLSPLTDEKEEWEDVSEIMEEGNTFQNNRLTSVFKKGNKAYYIDAVVFRGEDDTCFTGSAEYSEGKIYSSQYIKSFPFTPKTFYIDIYYDEDGDSRIKNEEQLKEVFDYYDQK